jgi:hypothetical protein
MNQDDRRIRSLKLRTRDETLALQARYRLEEAFRTASLPGFPPNAQLLVWRFDLGSFRVDQAPVMLSGRISELMRNLAAAAACVDHRPAANANVVWFSDPLQPYKVVLLRLLDGHRLPEWYWRTLFPNQALVLNSATIGMVLARAAATPLRGLAPARLLQEALEPRRLAKLLPCITLELARRLLHAQGVSPVGAVRFATPQGETGEAGGSGVRPALAIPTIPQTWRRAIREAVRYWGVQDVRTLWFAWQAVVAHRPAWLDRRETLQRIAAAGWLESWAFDKTGRASAGETAKGVNAAGDEGFPALETEPPLAQSPAAASPPAGPSATTDSAPELIAQEDGPLPPLRPKHFLPVAKDAVERSFAGEAEPQRRETSSAEAGFKGNRIQRADAYFPPAGVAHFSEHAGFGFIIPLLQRLGMAELLACNERLVALDLPCQLLWFLARRFGMEESDPAWSLFAGFEAGRDDPIARFAAPDGWRRLVTPSGRPLNALGMAENGNDIQLHRLIKVLYLIATLYLHRHCGLSLRTLIHRPGRVVLTATHWDVIFDLNQIDLRLRRVALDSDPGWVAWLGRVVQFHYDSEEARYVQSGRDLGRR